MLHVGRQGEETERLTEFSSEVKRRVDASRSTQDTIVALLNEAVFAPKDIQAMSMALDDVCKELKLEGDSTAREVVAIRIIEHARRGERSPTKLRDRMLAEARGGTGC